MSDLQRRLNDAERRLNSDLYAYLRRCGMDPDRIAEVVEPGGSIRWDDLTDSELDALATTGPDRAVPGGPRWEDLSDEQLTRIAEGEDPEQVVRDP